MALTKKILIAEDQPAMRRVLTQVLKTLDGFELLEAGDGREALEIIDEHEPDLVLLDLWMPKMDGFEVLRTLESRRQSQAWAPRVVVLSGHSEPHLLEELQKLGAHDVLVKPLRIDQILGCVEGLAPKAEP